MNGGENIRAHPTVRYNGMPGFTLAAAAGDPWKILGAMYALYALAFMSSRWFLPEVYNDCAALAFVGMTFPLLLRQHTGYPTDLTVLCSLCIIGLSTIRSITVPHPEHFRFILKHHLLLLLYINLFSLKRPALNLGSRYTSFELSVYFLIGASLVLHLLGEGGQRASGVFRNANNLALMAYALLFFVGGHTGPGRRVLTVSLVVLTLAVASTAGAALGLLVLAGYKMYPILRRRASARALAFLVTLGVVALAARASTLRGTGIYAVDRVAAQMRVVRDNIGYLGGGQINYVAAADPDIEDSTSGLWRLLFWKEVLARFCTSSTLVIGFGSGIGTAHDTYGHMMHNDYLRVLVEQGLAGMGLYAVLVITIVRRMAPGTRMYLLPFGVYCWTENNVDNFVYMSLLVVYVLASERKPRPSVPSATVASR
jgi:O-antigen ligase